MTLSLSSFVAGAAVAAAASYALFSPRSTPLDPATTSPTSETSSAAPTSTQLYDSDLFEEHEDAASSSEPLVTATTSSPSLSPVPLVTQDPSLSKDDVVDATVTSSIDNVPLVHHIGHCAICDKCCTTACSNCEVAYYCSPEHSKKGWRAHKRHCVSKRVVKAVYLPVDHQQPQPIEVTVKRHPPEEGYPALDTARDGASKYMGPKWEGSPPFVKDMYVARDGINGPWLDGYCLLIMHRDTFSIDGSELNQCVTHLTRGQTCHPTGWKGPLVVMRQKTDPEYKRGWPPALTTYEDLDLSDIAPVVKYLQEYGSITYH